MNSPTDIPGQPIKRALYEEIRKNSSQSRIVMDWRLHRWKLGDPCVMGAHAYAEVPCFPFCGGWFFIAEDHTELCELIVGKP